MSNLLRQATLKGTAINNKYQEFRRTNQEKLRKKRQLKKKQC